MKKSTKKWSFRKLKIAQVAPLWYPVPPPKYGGVERVVYYLTEGLKSRGHKVSLFASGDSKTTAKLFWWRKNHLAKDKISWHDYYLEFEHLFFAFARAKKFDIIHCHVGPKSFFFLNFVKKPIVWTFHNPLKPEKGTPLWEIIQRYKKKIFAVFLTQAHKKLCQVKFKKTFVVPNGIDLKKFPFSSKPKDYFLWVGRVEPLKGPKNAIWVAKKLNKKLLLVGKVDPEKREYFEKEIKPFLGSKIKYLGELPHSKLAKIYQGAIALLYPIEWEEPFGLVMVESMACGTPVVVFDRGSAKEVVKHGKTGFVVPFLNKRGEKNLEGILEAAKQVGEIKREDCRKFVEKNFSVEKMVKNYEKVYYQILEEF